jgi:predicted signal transduction protein with EAL and GGDEF domain/CheY-like chemotaxis protein
MTDRSFRILVVDDDTNARLIMRAALRKAGFEVRLAADGGEALALFRAEPCDLVMLDVDMPGMGGYEVCAALRAEFGPLLPIVMVTGMDDVESVETAYQHGATDFVAKPVNWALIGHRVRYLFRGHQTMLDLHAAEARNAAVLDAIPDLLFEVDLDGRCIDCWVPRSDLVATSASDFVGRTLDEVLPPLAARVCLSVLHLAQVKGFSSGAQIELPGPDASKWFELSVSRKAAAQGDRPHFIMLWRDITERKVSESRITRLAYFDSLTGLPNRQSFLERVDGEVRRAVQKRSRLAVLFMDLDGFKNINDTMGHAVGDLILQLAAERLRDGLRPIDMLSRPMALDEEPHREVDLARLGGDEFTALILDINFPEDALSVAQRIGQMMRRAFVLDGREVTLTASIGIAIFPEDGADGATLLKHADTAMYLAKRSGRDNAQLYSAALTQEILQRMELDANLRVALERDEFHLLYQPQIHVASGRILSVEALIRWTHPVRGVVSPLDFISRAEENGLIEHIGEWVLRTACADAARWSREGHPIRVAVNLSPLQFRANDLPKLVASVLAETGLASRLLELEVTEGALMENSSATRATLQAMHDLGVRIALDDFGTGYSSLAYLTRMPIDHIKVDKCFVAGLLEGGESEAIVRAVLAMARSLGMHVTAEGVESLEQALSLKAMACDYLQGFHFSRPVRAVHIPELLSQHWPLDTQPVVPLDALVLAVLPLDRSHSNSGLGALPWAVGTA